MNVRKMTVTRCEAYGCNEVAILQVLGVRNVGLTVFDVCAKHHEERYNRELEKTYLRTYERLGSYGVKELDDFFKKLTK